MSENTGRPRDLDRRVVLRGAAVTGLAVPLLAGCGADSGQGSSAAEEPATSPGGDTPAEPPASGVGVPASSVPVGGGTVLGQQKVVITQPTEGQFAAFSAVCTHAGCLVQSVSEGTINCPCHGSSFSAEDGSVVTGPAQAPLERREVTVEGGQVTVG